MRLPAYRAAFDVAEQERDGPARCGVQSERFDANTRYDCGARRRDILGLEQPRRAPRLKFPRCGSGDRVENSEGLGTKPVSRSGMGVDERPGVDHDQRRVAVDLFLKAKGDRLARDGSRSRRSGSSPGRPPGCNSASSSNPPASAQNIAFHELGRQAVMADPDWCGGAYLAAGRDPARGWRLRAWPRISPISRNRRCTASSAASCRTARRSAYGFDADLQVESYLRHQGIDLRRPVRRQLLSLHHPGNAIISTSRPSMAVWLANAFRDTPTRFCLVSFTSDWLYPTAENRAIVQALNARRGQCQLRRDRERQGPRRLLAGRAGIPSQRARLPRRLRQHRGARMKAAPIARRRIACTRGARPAREHHPRSICGISPSMVMPGARVLDVGCGDGALLGSSRRDQAGATVAALRSDRPSVNACVGRGLLGHPGRRRPRSRRLPRRRLRLRVLPQTLQATHRGRIDNSVRIGRHAIVSFPNFGHWANWLASAAANGQMPVTCLLQPCLV